MNGLRLIIALGVVSSTLAATRPCRAASEPGEQLGSPQRCGVLDSQKNHPRAAMLTQDELKSLLPPSVVYKGMTAAVQLRDAVGLRFEDGKHALIFEVSSGGVSSSEQRQKQLQIMTEVPLEIADQVLAPGAYGAGFLDGRFLVIQSDAQDLFSVPAIRDTALNGPRLLQIMPEAIGDRYRLYSERAYVVITRARAFPCAGPSAAPRDGAPFAFSDKPNFAVAGIVDYTAVGGHGSDQTLRMSEDLTRETLGQPSPSITDQTPRSSTLSSQQSAQEAKLRETVASAPDNYAATHALGEFYVGAAHFAEAVPLLERASSLHGGAPEDEYAVALACQGVGDPLRARQHVLRALARDDQARFHRKAAELDEALGDPVGAVEQDRQAAQLDPSEANYFAWGSELLLHRAIWQAAEVFQRGIQLHRFSLQLKTGWAAALFAGAKYDEAAKQLCEASDLSPADREPYLMMGKVMLSSPAPLPCITQHFERFVALHPGDATANYDMAMSLLRQDGNGDIQTAEGLLRKAAALDPKLATAHLQLGILAIKGQRQAEAVTDFERAIAADPTLAEAHYRLGMIYDREGRKEAARVELERHEVLVKAQTEAAEEQRRKVKQFVVTPGASAESVPSHN